jgi:hypothetical protein
MSQQQQSMAGGISAKRRWPRWLRRGLQENIAVGLIALGVLMMVQPFSIDLYGWSFSIVLAGTVMFMIVSKFPE